NSFSVTGIRLDLELSDTVEFPDSIRRSASLLRRVKSRIRLCTHEKRHGRERDSRNAAWPGPTNEKEGRWRTDKAYYGLRDMYGDHILKWKFGETLPNEKVNKAWECHVSSISDCGGRLTCGFGSDILQKACGSQRLETCVRLIILKSRTQLMPLPFRTLRIMIESMRD
ncbi:hypothetical protein Tco_0508454, partial [Tanacetum coccineum]